ncbi:MAG: YncE family protein [Armatimonadota bacterium]
MRHVETDADTGVAIFQLTDGPRPTDDIYGEQPYASADGTRIAVRHYAADGNEGGLSIVDLADGSMEPIFTGTPHFPAFHAWGAHLYNQEDVDGALLLRRWDYRTLKKEDVLSLPAELGRYSYGTVSPDGRYYAVIVHPQDAPCRLVLFDLADGSRRVLAEAAEQYFKHEQFSLDGSNRILIQANSADVTVVNLGMVSLDADGIDWLPVDAPPLVPNGRWPGAERYTPRCTGHEAWIGNTGRVFLSTAFDTDRNACLWSAGLEDAAPTAVAPSATRFGHVSVSRCGRYWIADAIEEEGVPIYLGAFATGTCRRLLFSRTEHDRHQWSHTHPYLTADNGWLIFTARREGVPQVYGAQMREEVFE